MSAHDKKYHETVSALSPNGRLYYGTFINEQSPTQKMVHGPGFFKDFALLSDKTPSQGGTEKIAKAWMDSEGKAWFQVYATVTLGPKKNMKLQVLQRISEGGRVLEFSWKEVSEFRQNEFPKVIDPTDTCHYGMYFRVID
jgi:hypothetical protein